MITAKPKTIDIAGSMIASLIFFTRLETAGFDAMELAAKAIFTTIYID
jgi:hypothetical protein